MKCRKKGCDGEAIPFGKNMYGYHKCNKCGKLHLVEEKQSRLKFK